MLLFESDFTFVVGAPYTFSKTLVVAGAGKQTPIQRLQLTQHSSEKADGETRKKRCVLL